MPQPTYDVVAIGNAIVDVLAHADDAFLVRHGCAKGAMTLVDANRAEALYGAMGPGAEISGGSAANTVAGLASLGGKAAFIGKVRDDQLGEVYRHDLRAAGVAFETPAASSGPATGRCFILVTPDAQRTMNTFLGAAVELNPEDVDEELISRSKVTYLEGYLWDRPEAKEAFRKAAAAAHDAGAKVAFTLSDRFCVERWRAEFLDLIQNHVNILFANESEILALYQVKTFEEALPRVRGHVEVAALTRSEKGSVVVKGKEVVKVPAEPIAKVIDTTGAGDLYAAGFLSGYVQGRPMDECGRRGAIAAAEIISHFGARPETSLQKLVAEKLKA